MRYFIAAIAVVLFMATTCLFIACSDDNPTEPSTSQLAAPDNAYGMPTTMAGVEMMAIGWSPDNTGSADGFNIYRSRAGGDFTKLNDTLITGELIDPPPSTDRLYYYTDDDYDSTSADVFMYYVTAVRDTSESDPSDTIMLVPASIDRSEGIGTLAPDWDYATPLVPTFSWTAKAGAEDYLIILKLQNSEYEYWWMFRVEDTVCVFKADPGVQYLDDCADSLPINTSFTWIVHAIDSGNVAFTFQHGHFTTTDPNTEVVKRLVADVKMANLHRVCWDQTDMNDQQVAAGNYTVRMISRDYTGTAPIQIGAYPIPPPPSCDTTTPGGHVIPSAYSVEVIDSTIGTGGIFGINYSLPVSGQVVVDIIK